MKFSGPIGFAETVEIRPGVMQPKIAEKHYKGDVLRKISRWQQGEQANDDLNVNNQISIVANEYAFTHFSSIKYVVWMGTAWKVNTVTVEPPRLVLEIGGVYNGERDDTV